MENLTVLDTRRLYEAITMGGIIGGSLGVLGSCFVTVSQRKHENCYLIRYSS